MATGRVSSPFLYKAFTYNYSGVSNSVSNVTQANLKYAAPEGYTLVGIVTYSLGWVNGSSAGTTVFPITINPEGATSSTTMLHIRSISGSGQSGTARVVAVFAPTDMVQEV